jgi:hypothetical protein
MQDDERDVVAILEFDLREKGLEFGFDALCSARREAEGHWHFIGS